MIAIFTANAHDNGYELVPGSDITNRPVGEVFYQDEGEGNRGIVVRVGDDELLPVSEGYMTREVGQWLAEHGYEIDPDSLLEIAELDPVYVAWSNAQMAQAPPDEAMEPGPYLPLDD